MDAYEGAVFTGHNTAAAALTNSRQLSGQAWNLCKSSWTELLAWVGRWVWSLIPNSDWELGGESVFFKDVAPGWLIVV